MPKSIGEFINDLAQKAGIQSDNEDLKNLLASPELLNIKVNDELIGSMDRGLLNIDAAKNNHPDIKKKYFADAYDGVDKFLIGLIDDETFTPEDLSEIKSERSTTRKIELMKSKLLAAKSKADPAEKATINKQIQDLHEAVRLAKEEKGSVVKEYEGKIKDIHLKSALNNSFNTYKTIYDDLPAGVKQTSLMAMINQALQDNDAKLDVGDTGTLTLVRTDGSNVFGSDHRQHTPQSFLDKTLAPILKVSTPKPAGVPQAAVPPTGNANDNTIKSLTEKSLADMAMSDSVKMM